MMASVEIEYQCNKCKKWGCTGIRHPKQCEYCGSSDLYVLTNNLEVPCRDLEDEINEVDRWGEE